MSGSGRGGQMGWGHNSEAGRSVHVGEGREVWCSEVTHGHESAEHSVLLQSGGELKAGVTGGRRPQHCDCGVMHE